MRRIIARSPAGETAVHMQPIVISNCLGKRKHFELEIVMADNRMAMENCTELFGACSRLANEDSNQCITGDRDKFTGSSCINIDSATSRIWDLENRRVSSVTRGALQQELGDVGICGHPNILGSSGRLNLSFRQFSVNSQRFK